jgi:hypothetical protein
MYPTQEKEELQNVYFHALFCSLISSLQAFRNETDTDRTKLPIIVFMQPQGKTRLGLKKDISIGWV